MNPPDSKKCTKCGEMKPLEMFHRSTSSPDGRKPRCKICRSLTETTSAEAKRRWKKLHPEETRASKREYMKRARSADPIKYKEFEKQRSSERRKKNAAAINAYNREWEQKKKNNLILGALEKLTKLQPPHKPNDNDT